MRNGGVLLPIFSLPGPGGIGAMGANARRFVDFLRAAGQRYWQILPICPTSYGDSPYSSPSTFAGNPYFIDLEELVLDGLLRESEVRGLDWGEDPSRVDYSLLYAARYPVLRLACKRLAQDPPEDFDRFCAENPWLEDYALFMTLKGMYGGKPWQEWDKPYRIREARALEEVRRSRGDELGFWRCVQYLFYRQWTELKRYANDRGVHIIGDLPIYVSGDSVDVWANPQQFQLDGELNPVEVAGCPPDDFTADGQLWGNPLYNWDGMKADGYAWWMARISHQCDIYDVLRMDHFRGFEAYYAVPFGAANARKGRWRTGPGMEFFRQVEETVGKQPIIAEDLGFLTDGVRRLLKESGFPGMKILEFAFGGEDSDYLPHNYEKHCVVYTGTHDNSTAVGWLDAADPETVERATAYLGLTQEEGLHWGLMRGAWSSVADLAVVQMQDLLGLGDEARINTPSTVGQNWQWRMAPDAATSALAEKLRRQMELFHRV